MHYQTAYRWVRSGQLLAVKVGSGYEISDAALERFEAQRAATERLPGRADAQWAAPTAPITTNTQVLDTLDRMVDAVTLDATAVVIRATRLVADALGDGALMFGRDGGGALRVAHVAHRDPVAEVNATTIARDQRSMLDFIETTIRRGEPFFVPQVPQRELRRRLPPEQHMHIMSAGCYSAICAPTGEFGALLTTRDLPGNPYTRDDLAFTEAVVERVALACTRAARWTAAHELRSSVMRQLAPFAEQSDRAAHVGRLQLEEALTAAVPDDPDAMVALLDTDLTHLAHSKAYGLGVSEDPNRVAYVPLHAFVRDVSLLDAILGGELDYRSEDLELSGARGNVTFHVAMLRRLDATPWALVVVAHPTPERPGA